VRCHPTPHYRGASQEPATGNPKLEPALIPGCSGSESAGLCWYRRGTEERSGRLHFLVGFYGLLVGSKLTLAWGVARGRRSLSLAWYRRILTGSGGLPVVLGGVLIWQAGAGRFG